MSDIRYEKDSQQIVTMTLNADRQTTKTMRGHMLVDRLAIFDESNLSLSKTMGKAMALDLQNTGQPIPAHPSVADCKLLEFKRSAEEIRTQRNFLRRTLWKRLSKVPEFPVKPGSKQRAQYPTFMPGIA